jgi:hypothetical protein
MAACPILELSKTHGKCYNGKMNEIIFQVTEDEADGGFIARALGESIVTEADTWEQLRSNVREAVRCHFEEGKAPAVIRLHRVLDEVIALS